MFYNLVYKIKQVKLVYKIIIFNLPVVIVKKQHNFISRLLWPVQPRPSQSNIKVWIQALLRIREEYTNIPQHISPSWEQTWLLWYYDPNLATMYQKSGNTWQKWIRASHRG